MNYIHLTLYDTGVGFITRYAAINNEEDDDTEYILKWLVRNWNPGRTTLLSHRYMSRVLYDLYRERYPDGEIFGIDNPDGEPNLEHL